MNKMMDSIFNPSSRGKIRMIFIGILLLAFFAGNLDYTKYYNKSADWLNEHLAMDLSHYVEKPFRLGLDLQGGTHLVYEADTSQIPLKDRDDSVEGVRDVIERRVNFYGVSEPLVQTNKSGDQYRVIAELAGVKDVHEAIEMIGKTPLLEFKEENTDPPRELTEDEKKDMETYNAHAAKRADDILDKVNEGQLEFSELADEYSEDPLNIAEDKSKKGGNLGYISPFGLYADIYKVVKDTYEGNTNLHEFEPVSADRVSPKALAVAQSYDKAKHESTRIGEEGEEGEEGGDGTGAFSLDSDDNGNTPPYPPLSKGGGAENPTPEMKVVVDEVFEDEIGFSVLQVEGKRELDDKEVRARHILICWKDSEGCMQDWTKEEAMQKMEEVKQKITTENFAQLAQEYSTEPGADERGGSLGWFRKGHMVPEFEEVVFNMETGTISDIIETAFGYHLIFKAEDRSIVDYKTRRILVRKKNVYDYVPPQGGWKNTGLSGEHLERADVQFESEFGEPQIGLEFNDEGKELFSQITERNVNKPVAIFLDGMPLSTPRVNEPIREGKAVITGTFTIQEAKQLVRDLNSGALPVPIKLINQQTVGATLGSQSVSNSLRAALWGLLLVMIIMLFIYRLPGLIADLALLIYGILNLAVFKLIPITLTLAGIAGFILSVGMAVDANVLIFERLKEELRLGKGLGDAIKEGFSKAWPSIRDGNASTLITCFILMTFGTSMIKGFAITLSIGILISMFSAIIITRNFLDIISGWKWIRGKVWMFCWGKRIDTD